MEFLKLWSLITIVSPIILLTGVVIGVKNFTQLSNSYKVIVCYLGIALIVDLLFRYLGLYSHFKYNLFIIPIFGLLELAVFSTLYYRYILKSKSVPLFLLIILMHLLIIGEIVFVNKLFHQKSFQSFGKVIADSSIIFFCLLYYWQVFKGKIAIHSDISFLNATVIVYYSINVIIFLCVNFLVNENVRIVTAFWIINLISVTLFYIILIYLIWQDGKIRKTSR